MSTPTRPPWAAGPAGRSRPGAAGPHMRVSDAERAEVADRLSRHYGDGRLDQAEFEERLDRAMKAKTRADFDGLFTDLPEDGPGFGPGGPASGSAASGPRPELTGSPQGACGGPWHRRHRALFLVLVVLAAVTLGPALAHLVLPWLLIALVAFLVMRFASRRPRRN